MLNMFYERKISTEEVALIVTLRGAVRRAPIAKFNFWDDSHQPKDLVDSFQEAKDRGDLKHIKTILTQGPMSMVRFIRHVQKIEDRYKFCDEDRLAEVFGDGGAKFHLNNIDGWHP